jgi:uncharacterized protein (DUF1330 family)
MANDYIISWKVAGIALGLLLTLATALVKPLGVSTQFVVTDAMVTHSVAPEFAESNQYLSKYGEQSDWGPGYGWMLVLGMLVGAGLARIGFNLSPPDPVFLIGAATITNPDRLPEYRAIAEPLAHRTGGYRPLAFSAPNMLEGAAPAPGLFFIERYDSFEAMMAFVNSAEFQNAKELRDQVADVHFMLSLPAYGSD